MQVRRNFGLTTEGSARLSPGKQRGCRIFAQVPFPGLWLKEKSTGGAASTLL